MAIFISYPISTLYPYQPSALVLIWVSRIDVGYDMKIAIYLLSCLMIIIRSTSLKILNELQQEYIYIQACVPSEDVNQPVSMHSGFHCLAHEIMDSRLSSDREPSKESRKFDRNSWIISLVLGCCQRLMEKI